jgi:hypothetical protein
MEFNFFAILVAAVVPIFIGFLWYNPKTFGNVWMRESGLTTESLKGGNMIKIFGITFILSFMLAFILPSMVIHQMGAFSLTQGDLGTLPSYDAFLKDYGMAFRTFKHGAFHGVLAGIFIALPITGINALFERKSTIYIFINAGYWIVTLGIMGAIICGWK